ncbi:MAG TPA: DUF4118 domain-containing protein [Planktothrix sp.]|jgi:two-component system sensor histidine kinase KdpD
MVKRRWQRPPYSYFIAVAAVAVMTGFISITHADMSLASIPMLYLLVVTACALFFGSAPAVFASIVAFLAFDFFFVEPRLQFSVQNPAEWLALSVFLLTSTVTGQLTALLRAQVEEAQRRRLETIALAEASWAVASELDTTRAMTRIVSQIAQIVRPTSVAVLMPSMQESYRTTTVYGDPLQHVSETTPKIDKDNVAQVMSSGRPIGWDNPASEGGSVYLPVSLDNQILCVVFIRWRPDSQVSSFQKEIISSLLNHMAVVVERERLTQAEARAQALHEADKLKTALLSMVSHDFRSPLTAIRASVSSLLEEGEPPDLETQRTLLQGVENESERLNKMVGNILDLSRLEAGAWRPRTESVEASELIGSALDSFSEDDNERINVHITPGIAELLVDSVQIVQVVRNLIENALKYSDINSIVDLNASSNDKAVVIEVMDHGPGLPKGDEKQIFEPFYRAPGLKETSVPGVGIGLALCRGLVEANAGTLFAENREGGGAVFRVTLPANPASLKVALEQPPLVDLELPSELSAEIVLNERNDIIDVFLML